MIQPKEDRIEERQYKLRVRNNSPKYNKNLLITKHLEPFYETMQYENEDYESFYVEKYYIFFQYL